MILTSMPTSDITALVRGQLADTRGWNVQSFSVGAEPDSLHSLQLGTNASMSKLYTGDVQIVKQLIDKIENGDVFDVDEYYEAEVKNVPNYNSFYKVSESSSYSNGSSNNNTTKTTEAVREKTQAATRATAAPTEAATVTQPATEAPTPAPTEATTPATQPATEKTTQAPAPTPAEATLPAPAPVQANAAKEANNYSSVEKTTP